jgi:hypothetical protein
MAGANSELRSTSGGAQRRRVALSNEKLRSEQSLRSFLSAIAGLKPRSLMVSGLWTLNGFEHDLLWKTGTIFRDLVQETQKAPSSIAPTKTNAAHAASMLSFITVSTRRISITVVLLLNLAESARRKKHNVLLHCRKNLRAAHSRWKFSEDHRI